MSNRKLIGRVSATEKYPSSCDEFQFWLSDETILSPFDIVRVENKTDDSITYGVVQDILHITDGTGEQKKRLMDLVSLNVSELRNISWPDDLKDILGYYLIKYYEKAD